MVSTNNRSFRRSPNAAQHLAIGQMRAAETGRPIIQAGISGITTLVDARAGSSDAAACSNRPCSPAR